MTPPEEYCELLPWDTGFFGLRIGRVLGGNMDAERAAMIDDWSRRNHLHCLYFLARSDDAATPRIAESFGFRFVDIRLTLERRAPFLAQEAPAALLRPARPEDIPALQAIARASHTDSRFFYDPGFDRTRAADLYATWIELECSGRAAAVLIAATGEDAPSGYISCHLLPAGTGQIGLVGVAAGARGSGLGKNLVQGALAWFTEREVTRVLVVTQGRNCAAQRLYQRCGFLTHSLELWFHKWYRPGEKQPGCPEVPA